MVYHLEMNDRQAEKLKEIMSDYDVLYGVELVEIDESQTPIEENPMYKQGFADREVKAKLDEEQLYSKYQELAERRYYDGINTAWNTAHDVMKLYFEELHSSSKLAELFDFEYDKIADTVPVKLFEVCSCSRAHDILENYRKEQLAVGDFVTNGENIAIVTKTSGSDDISMFYGMFPDGSSCELDKSEWEKTDSGNFESLSDLLKFMVQLRESEVTE